MIHGYAGYATLAGTPARAIEEAHALERGLQLRELRPVEAAALALLSKGTPMQDANGETTPQQRAREARERMHADELELELTERIELRCTAADLARWQEAAKNRDQALSAFLRMAARERALQPALEQGALHGIIITLAQQSTEALQRIVAEVADRSDQLRELEVERFKQLVSQTAAFERIADRLEEPGNALSPASSPARPRPKKKKPTKRAPTKRAPDVHALARSLTPKKKKPARGRRG